MAASASITNLVTNPATALHHYRGLNCRAVAERCLEAIRDCPDLSVGAVYTKTHLRGSAFAAEKYALYERFIATLDGELAQAKLLRLRCHGRRRRVFEDRGLGQKLMTRAGIELKLKGGDRSEETRLVTYRGETSLLIPKVTDQVARFTPNQQSLWPLFSGPARSRGWFGGGPRR